MARPPWRPNATTARGLLAEVRAEVRAVVASGEDWRPVVDSLRATTPDVWASLGTDERRRFLRHVARYWEIHRHRVAPAVDDAIIRMQWSGQLTVSAGRLERCGVKGRRLQVLLRRHDGVEELSVGAVVNCTGPQGDVATVRDPLLDRMLARGAVRADQLHLGLDVTDDGAIVRRDGGASAVVWTVGPLRRGQTWEATAVPDIRVHAAAVAQLLGERGWLPASRTERVGQRSGVSRC